jgi:hypothetical protein
MAKVKKYKANDVVFGKNNTITLYMREFIYNNLEKIGKQHYKDKRNIDGVIKCYAMIKLHQIIANSNTPIPIHSELFANGVSKRHYTDFLAILEQENLIQIEQSKIENYKDKCGKFCIKQETNKYRVLEFGVDILGKQNGIYPVKLSLKKESFESLKIKYDYIRKHYIKDGLNEKRISTMLYKNNELSLVKEIVKSIKSKRQSSISRSKIDICNYLDLIKDLRERLERNSKEHIVGNNLDYSVDNKNVVRFDYYSELKFDIKALDECMCLKDLRDLASLNKVPQYGKDGKLYSTFSRIRRPIRRHITFRGEPLVEVSDISCAHFTMLPKIFEEYGIEITPWWELESWHYLTQQGDLYSEVVKDTHIPRDAIKPTFQSFFSIKNETSYIYGGKEKDCSNRLILCRWFSNNYPNIYNALLDWHNTQSIKIKRAANRVESNIMNPICDDLRIIGLHPFRLNDAIYLPLNEIDRVPFDITQRVYDYINKRTHINKVKTSYEAS